MASPETTASVVELPISEEAKIRREKLLLDETWERIYDYASRGDGACSFKAFTAALDARWNAAVESAEKIAQENSLHGCESGGEIYIAAKIAKAVGKLRRP